MTLKSSVANSGFSRSGGENGLASALTDAGGKTAMFIIPIANICLFVALLYAYIAVLVRTDLDALSIALWLVTFPVVGALLSFRLTRWLRKSLPVVKL